MVVVDIVREGIQHGLVVVNGVREGIQCNLGGVNSVREGIYRDSVVVNGVREGIQRSLDGGQCCLDLGPASKGGDVWYAGNLISYTV